MADNLIEQFFIDIELNTKGVGKQAKEIDKMLDSIGSKSARRTVKHEKIKQKAILSTQNLARKKTNERYKEDAVLRGKDVLSARKGLSDRLQAYKSNKSAIKGLDTKAKQDYITVQKAIDSISNKRADATVKREIDLAKITRNKNSEILKQQKYISTARTKQHVKVMTQKSEELAAMKAYYKNLETTSARTAKRVARQEAQIARVQGTAYYRGLKQSGMNTSALDNRLAGAVKRGDAAEIANVTSEMKRLNRQMAKHRTTLAGVGMMQKSVGDSTRNMIRSYVSLFALFEGTVAIKRVGQEFQGMEAAMLASSGSVEAAAADMVFLNRTVDQMGLNLKDTTDAWVKFKFAAQGKISQAQQEDVFTGLSMFGTALKVDDESMKRSQKALIQMMSKGKVMAEELKNQLGDSLPGAVQVFSRALNVSEAELFKMMEMGQLVSSEVLPKVAAELKKSALAGGAFEQALKGLRVTEGQMMTDSQRAGYTIFTSGFEEGLSTLYKTISDLLKTSGPQLEKLGSIFGKVFKGIAHMLKVLEPVMKVALNNFEALFGLAMIMKIKTLQKVLVSFGLSAQGSLLKAFLPLTAALAAAEELISLFSDKLVGNLESRSGMQFNLLDGTKSDLVRKDGKLFMDKGSVTDGTKPTMDIKMVTEKDFDAMSFGSKASYLWDVFSQGTSGAINATHMSAAKGVFGSGSSISSAMNPTTKTPTTVTINNTYNNATADEMLRRQQMQSMMGMSTTK